MTLDAQYWNNRYLDNDTGWDIGSVSTPLKQYIDQLSDKNIAVLIPGGGNSYEAAYLLEKGFTNITIVDFAAQVGERLKEKFSQWLGKGLTVICADFFTLEGSFDMVLEQTFFCALDPALRSKYAAKMHELLSDHGKLVGLLFDKNFEGGPPFGGQMEEYKTLFAALFNIKIMEPCYNSIVPRMGAELFVLMEKKRN